MATKKATAKAKKVTKKVTKRPVTKKTTAIVKKPVTKKKAQTKKVTEIDKNVRKIQRQANGSTTIVLPAELLRELKWKPKMNVVIKKRGEGILIEKPKKK